MEAPSPRVGEGWDGGCRRTMADERARQLRRNMTDAERALWRYLRMRQLDGHKFRKPVRIGPYIADFACLKAMLVIEVDGGQHAEACAYDSRRDDFMRGQGYRVLRFWNNEVLSNIDGVWQVIVAEINSHASCRVTPHPNLPPQGGKGLVER
jgi:very-short-patch-repair endonuclease